MLALRHLSIVMRIKISAAALFLMALLISGCSPKSPWKAEELALIRDSSSIMRVLSVDKLQDSLFLRLNADTLRAEMLLSEEYARLASKMVATVTSPEQDGVGLAAPQVGISRRMVAVQRFDKSSEPFEVYPNIRITDMRGEKLCGPEGCLSIPGRRGEVLRFMEIDIRYSIVDPKTGVRDTCETVRGFTAVIFQHECDHLDGILYTDRLASEP